MKDQIKTCPKCGSFVKGSVVLGGTEGFVQGFFEGATRATIDSFTGGIGGTILKASGHIRKIGDAAREMVTESTTIEFACPCGYKWQERIGNNEENIPEALLQIEKDKAIAKCKSIVSEKLRGMIIFGILTGLCIWYLIVNPVFIYYPPQTNIFTGEEYIPKDLQFGWIGMCILALIFFIPFCRYFNKWTNLSSERDQLKKMTPLAFKSSPLRNKYK